MSDSFLSEFQGFHPSYGPSGDNINDLRGSLASVKTDNKVKYKGICSVNPFSGPPF